MSTTELLPCPFCGAPGFAMLAAYGFKIKCTNTECTVETPIKTHRYQVDELWNRRASQPQQPAPADDKRALSEISRRALTAEARVRELEEAAVQAPARLLAGMSSDFLARLDRSIKWLRDGVREPGKLIGLGDYIDLYAELTHPSPAAAVQPPVLPLTEEEMRAIFLAHGFTIKEGHTDLKPYVYAAGRAIEAKVRGTGSAGGAT
jgi:hypothetical protein